MQSSPRKSATLPAILILIISASCAGEDDPDGTAGATLTTSETAAETTGEETEGASSATTGDTTPDPGGTTTTTATNTTSDPGSTSGGATTSDSGQTPDATTPGGGALPDFEEPGPYSVSGQKGNAMTANGCSLDYEIFTPDTALTDATVFMAHGFMRSIDDQAILAQHVASFGMEVITVSLCTNSFVGVDHAQNGEALAQLGPMLADGGPRVYSGFSAGGLAAFVAASRDTGDVAFLGLDPVDNGDVGSNAADDWDADALAAIAESGQCNSNNNFLPVFANLKDARVVRVVGAAHFDFEQDTCAGLECSFCSPAGGDIYTMARGMIASGAGFLTGAYPEADSWWYAGGAAYDAHEQAGRVASVQ